MKEKPNIINIWLAITIIVTVVVALGYILISNNTHHYSMEEWDDIVTEYNIVRNYNLNSPFDFPGLNPGDKIIISGNVTNITHNQDSIVSVLYLDDIRFQWWFEGNLTEIISIDDEVSISLTITTNPEYNSPGETIAEVNDYNHILATTISIDN